MAEKPRVLIIAGPNGAGKTTFATEYLPNEADCTRFVNADLIAAGLSPFEPAVAQFRAGRLMFEMIEELTEKRESFAIETTMSGRLYRRWISFWQTSGYRVEIHFLSLISSSLAIRRVAGRVRAGGHDVPDNVIRRRYERGWREFNDSLRDLVNEWSIYDISGVDPIALAFKERGLDFESSSRKNMAIHHRNIEGAWAALQRAKETAHRRAAEQDDKIAIWQNGKVAWIDPIVDQ